MQIHIEILDRTLLHIPYNSRDMHFKLIIVLLFSISVLNVGPGLSSQPFVKLQIKITRPPLENLM